MINKFQQGGKQNAIMQFVQGLAQVMQVDPNQIVQVAQQNPDALKLAVQAYQQTKDMTQAAQAFQQALQQKTQAMKHGAKLQYLKSLKHQCPEGEELYYYKKGGSVGCGCKKKEEGGEVQEAKCGAVAKFKAIRKAGTGTTIKKETVVNGSTKQPTIDGTRKAYEEFKKKQAKKKAQQKRDEQSLKDYEEGTYGETGNPPDSPAMSKEHIKKTEGKTYTSIRHTKSQVMKCGSKMKKKENGGIIEKFKIAFRNGGNIHFYQNK